MNTLAFISAAIFAFGASPDFKSDTKSEAIEHQQAFAAMLKRHVKNGRVDYSAIERESLQSLDKYLEHIATATLPQDRDLRIGFLIDTYNALVIRSVIHHNRPRSVLDIKGFFDRKTHKVAGQIITLDTLEKKVLNPFAKDPRTHFVLVCGAVGCPILESQPFFGSEIDERMEAATKRYLKSPFGARVSEGHLGLSKIFDWYAHDFGGPTSVISFVKMHINKKQKALVGKAPKVSFIDYNWTLNQL